MKDIGRRVHRWRKKFTPEKQMATIADIYDDMARRYEEAMSAVCIMEEKVSQVLDARGVHTSFYVPYLDFARQLFKLSRQQATSGESLAMEAKVLLDKRNGLPAAPMLTALNGWTGCARSAGKRKQNGFETDSA